jgi:hypothetical protein
MSMHELFKKSVDLVTENCNSNDVIRPTDTVMNLAPRIIAANNISLADILFVYVDHAMENHPVRAVITHREFSVFLDLVTKYMETNPSIDKLDLESVFPLRYFVMKTDSIEKVFNMFKADVTDTIIVLGEKQEYVGKIRRNQFVDTVKSLTS